MGTRPVPHQSRKDLHEDPSLCSPGKLEASYKPATYCVAIDKDLVSLSLSLTICEMGLGPSLLVS